MSRNCMIVTLDTKDYYFSSRVLIQSLRQCKHRFLLMQPSIIHEAALQARHLWLTTNLPRFFSKNNITKEVSNLPLAPPPHFLHCLGKVNIRIGPHIFESVSLFEARYAPTLPMASTTSASLLSTTSRPSNLMPLSSGTAGKI